MKSRNFNKYATADEAISAFIKNHPDKVIEVSKETRDILKWLFRACSNEKGKPPANRTANAKNRGLSDTFAVKAIADADDHGYEHWIFDLGRCEQANLFFTVEENKNESH